MNKPRMIIPLRDPVSLEFAEQYKFRVEQRLPDYEVVLLTGTTMTQILLLPPLSPSHR